MYAFGKDYTQYGTIWSNNKLFDASKVPHLSTSTPVDYDELLALAKKLTVRNNGRIQVYGLDMLWWAGYHPFIMWAQLAQQGVSAFNSDLTEIDLIHTPGAAKFCSGGSIGRRRTWAPLRLTGVTTPSGCSRPTAWQ